MNKLILISKVNSLKLYYNWYGFLFAITNKKSFFDKKIKIGILILSFISILASCNEQKTETKKNNIKPKISKNNDTTIVEKNQIKSDTIKKIIDIEKTSRVEHVNVSCYEVTLNENIRIVTDSVVVGCYLNVDISEIDKTNPPLIIAEQMPEFPNGNDRLKETLQNLIIYPKEALENKIEEKVFVSVVIEEDGSISNINLLRGNNKGLNKEAIRVIKLLPNYIPGKQNGEIVRVKIIIPIEFKLPKE